MATNSPNKYVGVDTATGDKIVSDIQAKLGSGKTQPVGVDSQTYNNFKQANPNLTTTAQDISTMKGVIPVDTLNTPVVNANVPNAPTYQPSQDVNNLVSNATLNAQKIIATPEPTTPTVSAGEKMLNDFGIKAPGSLEQAYTETVGGATVTPGELATKKTLATNLQNEITQADKNFRDRVTAIRQNPSGQFGGAVEAEVRKAQSEYDNDRANKMIAYNVALGDYTGAKEAVDTLFQLKTKDIENAYQYQKDIGNMAYKLADDKQKAELDAANKKADQDFEMKKLGVQFEYEKKLKNMTASASPKTSWQDLSGTGVKSLVNDLTGEVISGPGVGGSVSTPEQAQKSIDQLNFLRITAKSASDLSKASGASLITRGIGDLFKGDSEFRQLEGQTNTLKTNVMALMTDPTIKKFFGPQMSNTDVTLMTSAGTTLNPYANTPEQMKTEINRLDDLFNRMQTAVKIGQSGKNIITAPDGTLIQLTN